MKGILLGVLIASQLWAGTGLIIHQGNTDTPVPFSTIDSLTFAPDLQVHKRSGTEQTFTTGSIDSITFGVIDESTYPIHSNIYATLFWVGESADPANGGISNVPSAWRASWGTDYGVEDAYDLARDGDYIPLSSTGYKGVENPYYFALPYNDFNDNGANPSNTHIYWGSSGNTETTSAVKNQWIKITANGKTCYGQWEDSGPYYYDDWQYVFGDGSQRPINETDPNNEDPNDMKAGLDLSPAIYKYLGLNYDAGKDMVSWKFVNSTDVPDGPWKRVITTSGTSW